MANLYCEVIPPGPMLWLGCSAPGMPKTRQTGDKQIRTNPGKFGQNRTNKLKPGKYGKKRAFLGKTGQTGQKLGKTGQKQAKTGEQNRTLAKRGKTESLDKSRFGFLHPCSALVGSFDVLKIWRKSISDSAN